MGFSPNLYDGEDDIDEIQAPVWKIPPYFIWLEIDWFDMFDNRN